VTVTKEKNTRKVGHRALIIFKIEFSLRERKGRSGKQQSEVGRLLGEANGD
jgi:hypothetical protein